MLIIYIYLFDWHAMPFVLDGRDCHSVSLPCSWFQRCVFVCAQFQHSCFHLSAHQRWITVIAGPDRHAPHVDVFSWFN